VERFLLINTYYMARLNLESFKPTSFASGLQAKATYQEIAGIRNYGKARTK
jgi:hypothetical protein